MSTGSTPSAEPAWAAFAAIDWGSQNHFWSLLPAIGGSPETGTLPNTPEAVELWAASLRQRCPAGPIAVAIEQKRGSVIYMLSKYEHLIVYPVPPSMSASYRRAFRPSGAKNDSGDAALLLDLLLHHRDRLRPLLPDTPDTRTLRLLVELRRQLVQQRVRWMQMLIDSTQQYFPQLRAWFGSLDRPLVDALLDRWPTLSELQRANPSKLRRFFLAQNCRDQEMIDKYVQAIYAAVPATNEVAVIEAATRKTAALLRLLEVIREQIDSVEKRIAAVVANHPDAPIFQSFPGAGAATVPRLIAAFGTCRDTWTSAEDLQTFSGIAPVHINSGNSTVVRMRHACPKFLRQTFHEFAGQSIPWSQWAKTYYLHHLGGNKANHHAAVRSLACRWIRILYRCWKDRQPYDERIFLEAQRRRNSPLRPGGSFQWAGAAGFQRLSNRPS